MIGRTIDEDDQPNEIGNANLLVRYQRVLRSLRLKRLLPWSPFQFGARWHNFGTEPKASTTSLSEFEDKWGISRLRTYRTLLENLGDGFGGPYYGISPIDEWCAPESQSDLPGDLLRTPFDPGAPRTLGLMPGAMRICNVGCEHYYLLAISGSHAGELTIQEGLVTGSKLRSARIGCTSWPLRRVVLAGCFHRQGQ